MDEIIEILETIKPDIDYASCTNLVDGHLIDSLSILSLVAALEDAFDIVVPAVEIIPHNFNSAANIHAMVERLADND